MNDLELAAISDGLFAYLQSKTESPLDGIAVLGITLLSLYDRATDGTLSIDRFAEDFKRSLIESWKTKSDKGPGTIQ